MGEVDRFDGVEGLQPYTRCDVDGCVDAAENATNMVTYADVGPGHSCDLESNAREDAGMRERGERIDCRGLTRPHDTMVMRG